MKTLVAIPARYGSTRFPGKILAHINGRPMIEWVVRGVQKSASAKDIVVMTDDQRIYDVVLKIPGTHVVMTSENCPTGTDRIFEGLAVLEKQGRTFDYVINVQGDEPLISNLHLDPIFKKINAEKDLQMLTLGTPITASEIQNPNCVKVILDQNKNAIYFSRFPIPFSREKEQVVGFDQQGRLNDRTVLKHIGLYGYSVAFLKTFCRTKMSVLEKSESLEQLRALSLGVAIHVLETDQISIGIDTPEDLNSIENKIKSGEIKNL